MFFNGLLSPIFTKFGGAHRERTRLKFKGHCNRAGQACASSLTAISYGRKLPGGEQGNRGMGEQEEEHSRPSQFPFYPSFSFHPVPLFPFYPFTVFPLS